MKSKFLIFLVLICILVVAVIVPRWKKTPLLDSASLQGTVLFDGGTRIYMHTNEKLEHLPTVFVKTAAPQDGQTQVFDVSIYRNKEDVPPDGEILPCAEGDIGQEFAIYKEGTAFHFFISHSTIEGDKYHFLVNGKKLGTVEIGPKVIDREADKGSDTADAEPSEESNPHDEQPTDAAGDEPT